MQRNDVLNGQSRTATDRLLQAPLRERCPLCASPAPDGPDFLHRGAPYFACAECGHIASLNDSARLAPDPDQYEEVYPALDLERRKVRMRDIYLPKLDWVLDVCVSELGIAREELLGREWLEIGCGEGLFLEALKMRGATRFSGLGVDDCMLARSRELLGEDCVRTLREPLGRAVAGSGADIVAAWFVLEHVFDLHDLALDLAGLPSGTLFCFAVPVYGVSAVLESACPGLYPRTLDNRVHTQLFTDRSISHFMKLAGLRGIGEWIFGQDAADMARLLEGSGGESDVCRNVMAGFGRAVDDLQAVLDRHGLADSRHVVAVKE